MDQIPKPEQAISFLGFGNEAIAAIIVFLLGVIFTIVWSRFQKERHRVTFEVEHQELTISAPDEVKSLISIMYSGVKVESLHSFNVTVRNAGNRGVQDQIVRFNFPNDAELLSTPGVEHDPLIGPVNTIDECPSPISLTYKIQQLPVNAQVAFRILTKNNADSGLKVSGRNDRNIDTKFLERDASKRLTVKDNLSDLVLLYFAYHLLNLLPPMFVIREVMLGINMGIIAISIPKALSVTRAIYDKVFSENTKKAETNITAFDSARVTYVERADLVRLEKADS